MVTGANKGIGREIARRLATKGYTVWMGCRDAERGRSAVNELAKAGLNVHLLEIDVASESSVKAAAETLARQTDHLDALVNNAGLPGFKATPLEESMEDIKAIYEVNVFGPMRVTRAFQDLLIAAPSARVVNMANAFRPFGIKVNSADPGYVATDLNDHSGPRTVAEGATPAVWLATLEDDGPTGKFFNETDLEAW
jgi:NAD(P)-dependent dehydrogenase (short-subunit alcohol dehydrogenase family)